MAAIFDIPEIVVERDANEELKAQSRHLNLLLPSLVDYFGRYEAALDLKFHVAQIRKDFDRRENDIRDKRRATVQMAAEMARTFENKVSEISQGKPFEGDFGIITNQMSAATQEMSALHKEMSRYTKWEYIAFRDAAFTIYHMSYVLGGISQTIYSVNDLKDFFDLEVLKAARRNFNKQFHEHDKMRDAVGHSAELIRTTADIKKHTLTEDYEGDHMTVKGGNMIFIGENILGDEMVSSINGKIVSVKLDIATLKIPAHVVQETLTAFKQKKPGSA